MGRSALIVLICAGTAGAQNPSRHPFTAVVLEQAISTYSAAHGDGVAPPVPLMQCRQPEYTEEARLAHLAGLVTLSLTVDDEGRPADIHVVSPLGLGLDESAVACMSQSRYSPAQQDGKPVPSRINVSVG